MPLLILIFFFLMTTTPACQNSAWAADDTRWVDFTYPDNDYVEVAVTGTFTDWVLVPLELDGDAWSIRLEVPTGRQYYHFSVLEENDEWNAIDPENRTAINHEEFGWVSVLKAGEDDDARERRREERREQRERSRSIRRELKHGQGLTSDISYQRVDGLVINLNDDHVSQDRFAPAVRWHLNYGFSSGRFGAGLAVLQPLAPEHLYLKLALYDRTAPNNRFSGIGLMENSLAGFFLHEDYMDYHRSKGVQASLVAHGGGRLRLEAGVRSEENSSLGGRSVWSFKKGEFIPNPAIDEGNLRSFFAEARLGGKRNHLQALYERCGADLMDGDFAYERLWVQARGRLDLGSRAGFDARLAAGRNLAGRLPLQERFLLGGLGTVRGYGYQSLLIPAEGETDPPFGGEMSLLANVEYSLELGDDFGLALFYDTGMAWQDPHADVRLDDLKSSAGLGLLLDDDDDVRLDIIQRLDDGDHPLTIQLRLRRGF